MGIRSACCKDFTDQTSQFKSYSEFTTFTRKPKQLTKQVKEVYCKYIQAALHESKNFEALFLHLGNQCCKHYAKNIEHKYWKWLLCMHYNEPNLLYQRQTWYWCSKAPQL